jgi:hypothetical protein
MSELRRLKSVCTIAGAIMVVASTSAHAQLRASEAAAPVQVQFTARSAVSREGSADRPSLTPRSPENRVGAPKVLAFAAAPDTVTRSGRIALHSLVGAAVGAAAGGIGALYVTSQPRVTDHSEDGLAYIMLMSAGAIAGLVVGTVVGVVRTR